MLIIDLKENLQTTWEGSGYSVESLIDYIITLRIFGYDKPFSDLYPIVFCGKVEEETIYVVVTGSGFNILKPV
jgi:hypothetical protein